VGLSNAPTIGPTLVSVIVPTRDRPALLREALASIRAIETETLTFEILVGDNGADPESKVVAEEFGAFYMTVQKAGAGAARNAGLKMAKGEYIAFLDDDDVWLPANIVRHLEILRAQPRVDVVFGQVVTTDLALKPQGEPWPAAGAHGDALVRDMLSGYYPQLGATVVRAKVAREIGLFDERLLGDQDWDWQLRLARRRRTAFTPTPGVLFRQRAPGSFDKLRAMRVKFARRVFLRHALPEWKVFGGPVKLVQSYVLTLRQHFDYFVDAAASRANAGEPGAWRALFGAFRVFPARTLYHVAMKPKLRGVAMRLIMPQAKRAGAI
jgi:glycosyltransferase involved in cell wall biosynthesis